MDIDIIGTPDEEAMGCKVDMCNAGVFKDYDFAINTVISQCELWTDNVEPRKEEKLYKYVSETELSKVAETADPYGEKK